MKVNRPTFLGPLSAHVGPISVSETHMFCKHEAHGVDMIIRVKVTEILRNWKGKSAVKRI